MITQKSKNVLLWGLAGVGAVVAAKMLVDQSRKIDFREKVVVITGGSRGLGLVMARQLAKEGAKLAICSRSAAELERAKFDLLEHGADVFAYPCDLTNKAEIGQFFNAVRMEYGQIDVLINNAATIQVSPFEHLTDEDFNEALNTTFWASYHCINEVLPEMRERKAGRIVNISSFGGKVPVPHLLSYVTAKFALTGYSEGLRAELIKDNIYVTTICPGLIRTGSPRNAIFKGQNEKEYAWFKIGDSLPLLSDSAEKVAAVAVNACRYGKAEEIVSLPAQAASAFHGLFPGLTTDVLAVVNTFLPAPGGIGEQRAKGYESESKASESVLAALTDKAAAQNNQ